MILSLHTLRDSVFSALTSYFLRNLAALGVLCDINFDSLRDEREELDLRTRDRRSYSIPIDKKI